LRNSSANLIPLGTRGAVMTMIMDLLFREYLKAKLVEMKALPAVLVEKQVARSL
jgi:hypothetical protein